MDKAVKYLFVDLDGTLIRSDLFIESIIKSVKQNPFSIVKIIFWIIQGRSVAKDKLANSITLDIPSLPYETELISYIKEKKAQHITCVLATASNRVYAEQVAEHLGIFDLVIASDKENNLKGKNKLSSIIRLAKEEGFFYAGDSKADRCIWQQAAGNIFVNAPKKDVKAAQTQNKIEKVIISRSPLLAFFREMRIHQYAKNFLIFVPLLTSHQYFDQTSVLLSLLAFFCFSLCASGVYFLNDLLDLESDRHHAKKRFRPLASGSLPLSTGVIGTLVLPAISFLIAGLYLPPIFFFVIIFYYLLTNLYSFYFKRLSTIDVMTLAILYTLRIIAGSMAIAVELSSWLLAFSIFMFVSLAYLKRYIELSSFSNNTHQINGRGYNSIDAESVFILGVTNISISVLILALYINSPEISSQYMTPEVLWGLCWLMLYWSNRIWIGARRGKINDDPIVFALKDKVSRMVGVGFIICVFSAKHLELN